MNKLNYPTYILRNFWSKVIVPEDLINECWLWTAYKDKDGYGRFQLYGSPIGAHQFSYQYYYGNILNNMCVCHTCDNRSCVNPNHFFIGSNFDNTKDRHLKGRNAIGSNHGNSILSEEDVINILTNINNGTYVNIKDIYANYNVNKGTIRCILEGKTWRHITDQLDISLESLKNKVISKVRNCKVQDELIILDIRERFKNGESITNLAKKFGRNRKTVYNIVNRISWKHI